MKKNSLNNKTRFLSKNIRLIRKINEFFFDNNIKKQLLKYNDITF